jgi:hypothetical protein
VLVDFDFADVDRVAARVLDLDRAERTVNDKHLSVSRPSGRLTFLGYRWDTLQSVVFCCICHICLDFRIAYCITYNMALHVCVLSVSEMSLCPRIFLTFFAGTVNASRRCLRPRLRCRRG